MVKSHFSSIRVTKVTMATAKVACPMTKFQGLNAWFRVTLEIRHWTLGSSSFARAHLQPRGGKICDIARNLKKCPIGSNV